MESQPQNPENFHPCVTQNKGGTQVTDFFPFSSTKKKQVLQYIRVWFISLCQTNAGL